MEQNNKRKAKSDAQVTKQIISTLTSLGGYIVACVLIGMFLDHKYFNNNGIAVVVSVIIGIIFVVIGLVRLVIISRDN